MPVHRGSARGDRPHRPPDRGAPRRARRLRARGGALQADRGGRLRARAAGRDVRRAPRMGPRGRPRSGLHRAAIPRADRLLRGARAGALEDAVAGRWISIIHLGKNHLIESITYKFWWIIDMPPGRFVPNPDTLRHRPNASSGT